MKNLSCGFCVQEAGLDLCKYRLGTLKRRIGACLRALHANTFADARPDGSAKTRPPSGRHQHHGHRRQLLFPRCPSSRCSATKWFPGLFKGRYGLAICA